MDYQTLAKEARKEVLTLNKERNVPHLEYASRSETRVGKDRLYWLWESGSAEDKSSEILQSIVCSKIGLSEEPREVQGEKAGTLKKEDRNGSELLSQAISEEKKEARLSGEGKSEHEKVDEGTKEISNRGLRKYLSMLWGKYLRISLYRSHKWWGEQTSKRASGKILHNIQMVEEKWLSRGFPGFMSQLQLI